MILHSSHLGSSVPIAPGWQGSFCVRVSARICVRVSARVRHAVPVLVVEYDGGGRGSPGRGTARDAWQVAVWLARSARGSDRLLVEPTRLFLCCLVLGLRRCAVHESWPLTTVGQCG